MRGRKWLLKNIIVTISSIRRLLFYENRILWLMESIRKMWHRKFKILSNSLDVVYNYFWEGKKNKLIFILAIGELENEGFSPKI